MSCSFASQPLRQVTLYFNEMKWFMHHACMDAQHEFIRKFQDENNTEKSGNLLLGGRREDGYANRHGSNRRSEKIRVPKCYFHDFISENCVERLLALLP
jgi:hypothetical protein